MILCFCSDIWDVEPFHHFTCGKIANLTPMFVSWCLHARIYTAVNWRISNLGHMHNNWNFIGSTDRYWCDELNKIPLSTAPVVTVVCWIHSSCILLYQSVSTMFGCLGYSWPHHAVLDVHVAGTSCSVDSRPFVSVKPCFLLILMMFQ